MSVEDGTVSTHPLDNGERVQLMAGHGWGKEPERHEQEKPQTCHESLEFSDKEMASVLELDSAKLLTTTPETQGFAYPEKKLLVGFESTNESEYQQSEQENILSTEALLETQPGDPEGTGKKGTLFPYTRREDGTQGTYCREEVGSIREQSNTFSTEGKKLDDTELSIVESEFVELEGDVRSKCKHEIERPAYELNHSLLFDDGKRRDNLQHDQNNSSLDLELDGDSLFIRREMDISILFRDKLRIPKENFLHGDHQSHTSVAQSSSARTASKAESDTLDQLHFMEREFSAAMVQIEGQSQEIENLKAQLASVEEQFATQAVFIDDLTVSEQRAKAEAARLASAIKRDRESAEGKDEGSASQLQKQLSELEARNAFLEDALTQLKSQSEDQAREFVRQVECSNAQTKEVVAREAKLLGELEESQSKYSSEVETCQVLQRSLLNLETELDNVKAANQKLEQQVSQMDWVQNNAEASSFRNSRQQPSQNGARSSISGAPREVDTQKGKGLHQSAATHGLALNHSHGESPWSEAKGNYTNKTDEMAAEAVSTRIHEEELLHRLREERACLDQAENRIRIATMQSSKSLEHVTKELSSVQRARQIAEARAQELEQQLQKTQHNIVTLHHSSQNLPSYPSPTRSEPLRREEAIKVSSCQSLLDLQINPTSQDTSSFTERNDHEQQSLHDLSQARAGIQAQAQDVVQAHAQNHAKTQAQAQVQAPAQVDIKGQETPHTRAGSLPVEAWATSRQSMAPFATESSSRDLQQGFSLLERKLMMINMEREKCEADYARIVNKGVKTKKALDEKIFLEKRLDELHKEASNVRVALKRQPK